MACFYRLTLLVFLFLSSGAVSAFPMPVACKVTTGGGQSAVASTCAVAAADDVILNAFSPRAGRNPVPTCNVSSPSITPCYVTAGQTFDFATRVQFQLNVQYVNACPPNSSPVGGKCECAAGYAELGGTSCVVDNGCMTLIGLTPPNDGACTGGVCQYGYKVNAGEAATALPYGRFCSKSCTVKGNLDFCGQYSSGVMVSGRGVCQVSSSFYTGDKCNGSSEVSGPSSQGTDGGSNPDPTKVKDEANPVPEKLPPGKCPGQVNGVDVVVTCGSSASNDKKSVDESKKPPDGPAVPTPANSTTTTTTICNGNACQKITTVTNGGSGPNGTGPGSTTTTTKEEGTRGEICKGSTAAACKGDDDKKPTGFGGSCAGGYKAVSEDAVINAMAEETFRQNCKINPDDASQTVGREESAKTGNQTGSNPNNASFSIGAGSFDSSNALGVGASCIADKTIVVMGRSINIAFSMICQYLEALGLVMVGVAFLLAARIVTRG